MVYRILPRFDIFPKILMKFLLYHLPFRYIIPFLYHLPFLYIIPFLYRLPFRYIIPWLRGRKENYHFKDPISY